MDGKYKLGSTMSYDPKKEKDIIDELEKLRASHKQGEYISNLIRVAFRHPNEMRKLGFRPEDYGVDHERQKFFRSLARQVDEMSQKVDKTYEMAIKTYSLAMFNKKIGLEQKSTNILQTQFVLQRQIAELCDTLGISNLGHTFESNKVYNAAKNVDETLEFIIDYYDGIVNEIKQNIVTENEIVTQGKSTNIVNSVKDEDIFESDVAVGKVDKQVYSADNHEDDEVVDFGTDADLDLLSNFLNE